MKHITFHASRTVFCLFLSLFLLNIPAIKAHPHSWVSVLTELEGDSKQLSGLTMFWTFDLMTTSDALTGQDLSAENQQQTLQALASEMLENIKESHYFTHLTQQGSELAFKVPEQAELTLEDYKLTLNFFLALKEPIPLPIDDLTLQVYEDTYYVDFLWLQADDLQLSEYFHADCQLKLTEPQTTSEQITYVSSLERNAQGDNRLGAMFTQSVSINCS